MAKAADKKTLDLIQEVRRRKQEIQKAERPNWKTNCSFSWVEGSAGITNIHVESSVRNLLLIASFLKDKETGYNNIASALGIESVPLFTWCGYSAGDWLDDIRSRVNKIQIAAKKDSLEKLELRLNAIISPELRAELELASIAEELA